MNRQRPSFPVWRPKSHSDGFSSSSYSPALQEEEPKHLPGLFWLLLYIYLFITREKVQGFLHKTDMFSAFILCFEQLSYSVFKGSIGSL